MKKKLFFQVFVLLVCIFGLAAIHGCGGGGGGGGGTSTATAPSITTASLPPGVRGQLYSVALGAAGGTTPYGWSATGLPPGISLDAATGVLSGTPTTDSSYAPVFTVTDHAGLTDSKSHTFVIQPLPSPSVSTVSLPLGVRTQPYAASLAATSGTPPYAWSATGLPAGIALSSSGSLGGTPTAVGTFTPNFTVTDNNGLTGSRSIQIVINSPPSPVVATTVLPSGIRTQTYSASLSATSGTTPYAWSVTAGTLPAGVSLNGSTGALSGTPTAEGAFTPTFTVTDANGLTGSKPLSIRINPPDVSPVIVTSSLPDGARTEPYSASLSATSGAPTYAWSATGLPAGISLSAAGVLTGTPSVEGTFSPVFTVTDSASMQALKSLDLRIAKPLALFVADYITPSGAVNMFDNASVANGVSAWTRQLKGALTSLENVVGGPPAGVSYDAARKILYVARTKGSDNGAVLAFNDADTRTGNVPPDLTIRYFTFTPYNVLSPSDVFIDSAKDRIYIAYVNGSSGVILLHDSVNTTPVLRKTIDFPYGPPAAISVDTARDILYVVPSEGTGFIAFDNVSNPSGGVRTIAINSAVGLVDVKIDPATDTAYVADYNGGRVFVINNVSQKSGTYAPNRTLTGLSNPNSLFLDVANDRLFVSNRDGATSYSVRVVENMSSVNGPVSFSRQLSGFGIAAGITGYYK